ncbi:hypothetical protein KM427_10825 [Nocardioides sp. LMS-CY]|uniref:hypothetical protein n=1 Tax=Nocardioides sp. (strain LMS-CY) TaxID=2840457 RepID=UPI001C00241F|nr:hypothetical protein [Nocardioides sp. LMS-CY]QWF24133.1 hypothetical protein KM427_10825 [Nocardioides sp. LMS-CY]
MRFRKLLVATAAIVAAGAMALAPAAQAVTPSNVDVGGDSSNSPHAVTGAPHASASLTLQTLLGNVNLSCSSGSASGTVNGGSFATAPPNPVFDFSALTLNCDSFVPGTTITFQLAGCHAVTDLNSVTSGVSTGVIRFRGSGGVACLKGTISNGCIFWVGGDVAASFDNAVKPDGYQHFTLNGTGATIFSSPAAPSGCSGLVSTGNSLVFNNVILDLTASDGTITVS